MTDVSRRNVNLTEGALRVLDALNEHYGRALGKKRFPSSDTVSLALIRMAREDLGDEETELLLLPIVSGS